MDRFLHGVKKKVVVCLVWLSFLGGGALLLCFVAGTMVIHVCPFFSRLCLSVTYHGGGVGLVQQLLVEVHL